MSEESRSKISEIGEKTFGDLGKSFGNFVESFRNFELTIEGIKFTVNWITLKFKFSIYL